MKKKTTITTMITMVILAAMLLTGCGGKEAKATDSQPKTGLKSEVKPEEVKNNVFPEGKIDENSYLNYEENLKYEPDEGETTKDYQYNGYTFIRFKTFLSVRSDDNEPQISGSQLLSGTDFILCEDEIWYVNEDRKVSCFKYTAFDYPEDTNSSYEYLNSEEYTVYQNADLTEKEAKEIDLLCKEERFVQIKDKTVAFLASTHTVLFKENTVSSYSRIEKTGSNISDHIDFPFNFKEIGLAEWRYEEYDVYAFVSTTNTVGTITVFNDGKMQYNIIAEGTANRSLFHSNEKNHVTRIELSEGWVIYYENGKLIGSNGEIHFNFDDMKYEAIWIGDSYGVGKGIGSCVFISEYEWSENEPSVEQMIKETGIKY